ncbi:MAG: serine hydroxymethyltransferase, partial [Alphaproteobacteria bacterium]|nr:serine hydroxymethyltransferase [Alphaproteobacteria bacterium]
PHSGSQANQAVLLAFLKPGDTILGMSLDAGGHLTHGSRVNLSGKWFNIVAYGLEKSTGRIDYAQLEERALKEKPKLIIAGGSAYPRNIDFKKFREVADKVGAYLMVDMAHFAGLVAGGVSPNPLPYAHMVTTTTHKTMRGPRGGMILSVDDEIGKKINSAVFPGLQGGPLMHIIAAKAVAFKEALQPNFKIYVQQIIKNAKALSESLLQQGFNLVSGGTDTHLLLVDLHNKGVTGKDAEAILERAFLTCNKNSVPMDEQPPTITSGIRLGTPAGTTRGFGEDEFRQVGEWIGTLIHAYKDNPEAIEDVIVPIRKEVQALCGAYPIYDFQGKGGTSK